MKKIYILIMYSLLATALHAQDGFGTYLRDVIQKQEKGILVTAKLIEACGLCDSLDLIMDYEYEKRYQKGEIPYSIDLYNYGFSESGYAYAPKHRYYGYTLFAESDELWESLIGKQYASITADDVKSYLVTSGMLPSARNNNDYQDENNVLNQFVTYHLLPYRLAADKLVNHINEYGYSISNPAMLTIPVTEYYVTMGKRRLLRTYESKESNGVYINRFPQEDKSRQGSGHEISCDPDKEGIFIDTQKSIFDIRNAIVYPINKVLAYTEDVAKQFGLTRLRFDISGLFPELSNNDIRLKRSNAETSKYVYIPNAREYPYLADLDINEQAYVIYSNAWNSGYNNLNSDEMKASGYYDITLRLPPIPKRATYEIRYKVLANSYRGIAHVYFGTNKESLHPVGIPIDFSKGADSQSASQYGWQADRGEGYADQMTDNEMHYNGVMKGVKSIYGTGRGTEREDTRCIRHILVRQLLDPDQTYYLRFKTVLDNPRKELFMDYIEFCPREVYDNPDEPEDIW